MSDEKKTKPVGDAVLVKKQTDFTIDHEIIGAHFEKLRIIRRGKGKKERGTITFDDITQRENELIEELWVARMGHTIPMPRRYLKK